MTQQLRNELVDLVEVADVSCPEIVCDWVLDAAKRGGRNAGLAELNRAVTHDTDHS